ncbi:MULTISPECIES: DNA adenine methylase [unclassified Lysinibacillus]|uniref:DNA adenine methylase n=1 Tax=unclassified Lysinibacillus TaxID=2636778 RepID=UPI0030F97F60
MTNIPNAPITPFLTWVGGKRWLTNSHNSLFPEKFNVYIEPFLGSGSVFFYLKPEEAILGDLNPDLILAYQALKTNYFEVQDKLRYHHRHHNKEYYYKMRKYKPRKLAYKAARFIYLNRTCFNGIYRVNRNGEFNVPIGSKKNVLLDTDDFQRISNVLQNTELVYSDFENLIDRAQSNDFIFIDPPYTVNHNNNGFIQYNEKLFSWEDQVRLCNALVRARERGAKILATNANHESVRELYENAGFSCSVLSRFSGVSSNNKGRSNFEELIIQANI